jgi:ADP-heptose:LPS heptosyltransferase
MEHPVYKNILCVRMDNMGDVIMSGPAIRALKESFGARITLLTSAMGAAIAPFMPGVDDVVVSDMPWNKSGSAATPDEFLTLAERLRAGRYDAAVIFTVYSQNPLPAALLCWQAGIPVRAAFCRENPYHLLTHWAPDAEPYAFIRHQVERDLFLARRLGAGTEDRRLALRIAPESALRLDRKLHSLGIDASAGCIVLHPGVSEKRREYPVARWIEIARAIKSEFSLPLLITGGRSDETQAMEICGEAGEGVFSLAGRLSLEEFIVLIRESSLVIAVNTVTAHIAAATGTPVVVLYAMTNPQHTPWMAPATVLPFGIAEAHWSRNEVVRWVNQRMAEAADPVPNALQVVDAAMALLAKAPPAVSVVDPLGDRPGEW